MALEWFESYLTNRSQCVAIGDPNTGGARSEPKELCRGVPQGSVLGPLLFTLYTMPLGDICRWHNVLFQLYADDQQVYLSFKPSLSQNQPQHQCITTIQDCIEEVRIWMGFNMLKLNEDKTEFITFGTQQQLSKVKDINIQIGEEHIEPAENVCNLGYHMDNLLKNAFHINKLSGQMYGLLKSVFLIRSRINVDTAKIIIQALFHSKIDYCNSLLAGSAQYQLDKVQRLQNMACRVVCNLCKFDHVSTSMASLHWLKIRQRIAYKIACLVFKCRNGIAPQYLIDLIPVNQTVHQLRSSTSDYIPPIRCRSSQAMYSSFASIGPRTWNTLPTNVKQHQTWDKFTTALKTHLFAVSYE